MKTACVPSRYLIRRPSVRALRVDRYAHVLADTGQENEFGAELERLENESHEKPAISAPKEDDLQVTLTEDSPIEDQIIVKFQGWMREWGEELEQQSEVLQKTAMGKTALVTYMQTKKYLQPFYRMLHARVRQSPNCVQREAHP